MGAIGHHPDVLLILAAISRYPEAIAWGRQQAEAAYGPVALASQPFPFVETAYYQPTMGSGLCKQFLAFQRLIAPDRLPQLKLQTNAWEAEYAAWARHAEPRPLNLDPGYLSLAKLVLASVKDHAHRIYLGQGIYAEVTLYYRGGAWRHREWTFPDYRRADYQAFFAQCREYYKGQKG
jgi:hypothetical protein